MATYGVLLTAASGQVFITPEATPLALYAKYSASSVTVNGYQEARINRSIGSGVKNPIVFFSTNKPASGSPCITGGVNNGILTAQANNATANNAFTLTAYVFGHFPQSIPTSKYGIAIWNDKGELILTHETRVLTDIRTIGQQGVNANSGINIDATLQGKWGIIGGVSGLQLWEVSGGGPGGQIFPLATAFTATYDGTNTRFTSSPVQPTPGAGSALQGYYNHGTIITAVRISDYD